MRTSGLQLEPRRQAILKAMGVAMWWLPAKDGTQAAKLSSIDDGSAAASPTAVKKTEDLSSSPTTSAGASGGLLPRQLAQPEHRPLATANPVDPAEQKTTIAAPPRVGAAAAAAISADRKAQSPTFTDAPFAQRLRPARWLYGEAGAPGRARWLVVTEDLSALGKDEAQATALLHNMLRAVGLHGQPAIAHSVLTRQAGGADAAASLPAAQLLGELQPNLVLAMGRDAAQALLGESAPLGQLRQRAHRVGSSLVVVTYGPAYLLRANHAKRSAWQDLRTALALTQSG